jgi:hypothetical protein
MIGSRRKTQPFRDITRIDSIPGIVTATDTLTHTAQEQETTKTPEPDRQAHNHIFSRSADLLVLKRPQR